MDIMRLRLYKNDPHNHKQHANGIIYCILKVVQNVRDRESGQLYQYRIPLRVYQNICGREKKKFFV